MRPAEWTRRNRVGRSLTRLRFDVELRRSKVAGFFFWLQEASIWAKSHFWRMIRPILANTGGLAEDAATQI